MKKGAYESGGLMPRRNSKKIEVSSGWKTGRDRFETTEKEEVDNSMQTI